MGQIQILDEHIANQIAAGEVVERPSSVVKELVENAIDAGARRIDVTVEEGGLSLIRITDNGSGIEPEDCETAFYRHATSKLLLGRDLFQIRTLGFRGEALPSIAAVSKVELVSSNGDHGLGRRVIIEGGSLKENEDTPAPQGTDISVKELFYNTPARLKYMKTIQTELGHISDVMYRQALAHPDIAFTLRHNGNQLLQSPGNGDLLQVIASIYGTQAAKGMLGIEAENADYKVEGFIGRPDLTRSNRGAISMMVNGRYIRNPGLQAAMMRAYHTLLPINRYPIAVLQLHMHPSLVDVNVHPSKLEVRFSKEQELYTFLEESIRAVLSQQVLIPHVVKQTVTRGDSQSIIQEQFNFHSAGKQGTNPDQPGQKTQIPSAEGELTEPGLLNADGASIGRAPWFPVNESPFAGYQASPSASGGNVKETTAGNQHAPEPSAERGDQRSGAYPSGLRGDSSSYGSNPSGDSRHVNTSRSTSGKEGVNRYNSSAASAGISARALPPEQLYGSAGDKPELPVFPELTLIGQHHGTYLIAQNEHGLYLIDQHAAHERVNYEYYYEKFGNPADASQELLIPITLEFTSADSEKLKSRLQWFENAGVILEHFGGGTFRVISHPYWFPQGEESSIIEEMAEWVLSERAIDLAKLRERSSILCSCKASIKANQKITAEEANTLLARLAACKQPYTCPHGRPIVVSFSTYDLEKMFKRVM
ncbi:DNA mismatch repair endonuclease MutL [Paenibacillus sp. YPG26]|uniref:DNA mismatch repair endonuclease MutL n=1 Tax=Paenibacillus sp. YPG26 TaxID=2878915 RepID=UPI00203EE0DF|nr:DNA mismatch repair endonuclease MutL [Paenibacillus sp. YPG26]USB34875.1 DNA mismatch repair endonuclease MutL [Paenibacillus sp. YPG26]